MLKQQFWYEIPFVFSINLMPEFDNNEVVQVDISNAKFLYFMI